MTHWVNNWFDLVLHSDMGGSAGSPETIAFILMLSFVVGHLIAWVYMWTHQVLSYSQTFVASIVVLPPIVAMMMSLMAGSIVVAFGLLAVFAVVRFRNVLKDTRDTSFVLWAIVEGMAVGTMRYTSAVIGVLFIGLVLLYLRTTSFGSRHRFDAVLTLQITGDLANGVAMLKEILFRHAARSQIASERRLTDEGVDLSYRLLMRDPSRSDELQWDLGQTEGIQHVSLHMRDDESEV